jgi:hypothetical protein
VVKPRGSLKAAPHGTGTVNGVGFTNAAFTVTSVADTSQVTRVGTEVELQATTSSIAMAAYRRRRYKFQNIGTDQGPLTVSASSNETFRAVTAGGLQSVPLLPSGTGSSGQFIYSDVASGLWFDPPTASAFSYTMTSNSLFTSILNFPSGFASPFVVSAGGVNLGSFSAGDSLVFPNGGVSAFEISSINPLVDPNNPSAFPLELAFNTGTASFTQQAVPEPAELGLFGAGLVVLAMIRRSRHSQRLSS